MRELKSGATPSRTARAVTRPPWLRSPKPGTIRDAFALHPIARRLSLTFAADRLRSDLEQIPRDWWDRHEGSYHDGAWESVSLWAPAGDRRQQRSRGGAFQATEALRLCPYIHSVLDTFTGTRHRVRLMRLRPGGRIFRHSDPMHTISAALTRIHVPIVTSPEVCFRVNGQVLSLAPGEAWTIDVRFPHEVENRSDIDRVHLVADVLPDAALRAQVAAGAVPARGLLLGYFLRHSLPVPVRRWLNVGN